MEERGNLSALAHELGIEKDVSLPGYKSNPFAYMNRDTYGQSFNKSIRRTFPC